MARPQTSAERQAAFRLRHLKDLEGGAERLSMIVSLHTKRKLERLACHQGITQRAALERLLADAERSILDAMTGQQQDAYCDAVTR
jgi:uncharacterized protein YbgA (DUF1722 family)